MTIGTEALSANIAQLTEEEQSTVNAILDGFLVDNSGNLVQTTEPINPTGGPAPTQVIQILQPGQNNVDLSDDGLDGIFIQGGGDRTLDASQKTGELTVVGGSGSETVTTGTGGSKIVAGAGADTVNSPTGGANDVDLGAGNDIFNAEQTNSGTLLNIQPGTGANVPSWFDSGYYARTYTDVAAAISEGTIASAFEHYIAFGEKEGKNPNANFNEATYLSQNPDVKAAVDAGVFSSGFEHYLLHGSSTTENRNAGLTFDVEKYLDANPDVAAAVAAGQLTANHHAVFHRSQDNRALSSEDTVEGGAGNDSIASGLGDDSLTGGTGNDTLIGGADDDTMTGGEGNDIFIFGANSDNDTITDFNVTQDKITTTGLSVTATDLLSNVTETNGNAVITLSNGNTITLVGVNASAVTADMFDIQS